MYTISQIYTSLLQTTFPNKYMLTAIVGKIEFIFTKYHIHPAYVTTHSGHNITYLHLHKALSHLSTHFITIKCKFTIDNTITYIHLCNVVNQYYIYMNDIICQLQKTPQPAKKNYYHKCINNLFDILYIIFKSLSHYVLKIKSSLFDIRTIFTNIFANFPKIFTLLEMHAIIPQKSLIKHKQYIYTLANSCNIHIYT